jgi:Uma2 family endonuclease
MATAATTKLMTAEEFAKLPPDGRLHELVRGHVVEANRPKPPHGRVMLRIGHILADYLDEHDIGHVWGGDSGMITERDPDTVRGGDVMFCRDTKIPEDQFSQEYSEIPPEILFEVMSRDDRRPNVLEKVAEYLQAGVLVDCVVEPELMRLQVFTPDRTEAQILHANDVFELPDLLPGFGCKVRRFFTKR